MIRVIVLLLAVWTIGIGAQQTAISARAPARPESVGMSSERLGRIAAAMQRRVDRGEIAGAVTLVARRGHVVHRQAVGYRDLSTGSPMRADSVFRIRSMTKPMITAAAMMLYEEGHFLLSDPISRWIPELSGMPVVDASAAPAVTSEKYPVKTARGPITVGHLLTHTAGLAGDNSGVTAPEFQKIRPQSIPNDTLAAFASRLSKVPLSFEPGSAWQYGFATDIIGRLIEVISGQPLDQFLHERLLEPLQMSDTHFYLPSGKVPRLTSVYRQTEGKRLEVVETGSVDSPYVQRGSYLSATGGLTSTVGDVFTFHQMMLNGGELNGRRLLGRKTVELITANNTGNLFRIAPGMHFGLGYAIVKDVGETGLSGSTGMYTWPGSLTTTAFVDPAEGLVAVMMIQLQPRSARITNEFQALVYQAIIDRAEK